MKGNCASASDYFVVSRSSPGLWRWQQSDGLRVSGERRVSRARSGRDHAAMRRTRTEKLAKRQRAFDSLRVGDMPNKSRR